MLARFCIGLCIRAASSHWCELGFVGLSHRQYKVYDKKISPTISSIKQLRCTGGRYTQVRSDCT